MSQNLSKKSGVPNHSPDLRYVMFLLQHSSHLIQKLGSSYRIMNINIRCAYTKIIARSILNKKYLLFLYKLSQMNRILGVTTRSLRNGAWAKNIWRNAGPENDLSS